MKDDTTKREAALAAVVKLQALIVEVDEASTGNQMQKYLCKRREKNALLSRIVSDHLETIRASLATPAYADLITNMVELKADTVYVPGHPDLVYKRADLTPAVPDDLQAAIEHFDHLDLAFMRIVTAHNQGKNSGVNILSEFREFCESKSWQTIKAALSAAPKQEESVE